MQRRPFVMPTILPCDEYGEPPMPLDAIVPMTPFRFAWWFLARLTVSPNPLALKEQNADNIDLSLQDARAAAVMQRALASIKSDRRPFIQRASVPQRISATSGPEQR